MIHALPSPEDIIRAEYKSLALRLGFARPPALTFSWMPGEADVGGACCLASPSAAPTIRVSIGTEAGAARVLGLLVHELTHAQGFMDHNRAWREAYASNVLLLWNLEIQDALTVPYRYDLDRVVEYRLQSGGRVPPTLVEALGDPALPAPRYRIALPVGSGWPLHLSARSARLVAVSLQIVKPWWSSRVTRFVRDLNSLPQGDT